MKGREKEMERGGEEKRRGNRRGRGKKSGKGRVRGRKEKGRSRYNVPSCRGPSDIPTRASLRGRPGLRSAAGRAARSAHLGWSRSVRLLSPACFLSAAAWTAARPARAPAAPRCVGCAGGKRVPSAHDSGAESAGGERGPRALPSRAASRCHLQPPLPPPGGRLGESRPWPTPPPRR